MKKVFEEPTIETIRLTNEAVMTGGMGGGTGTPGIESGGGAPE